MVYIITNQLTMVPNNLTACNSPVGAKFLSIHWYNFALATAPTTAVGFLYTATHPNTTPIRT